MPPAFTATILFFVCVSAAVDCGAPSVSSDVMVFPFLATSEGAEIMYQCRSGFQPQETITAVCGGNALWSPDPALHNCIGMLYT